MKQSSYKRDLFASIEEIKKRASRFTDEVNHCLAERVRNQETMLSTTNQTTQQSLYILESLYAKLVREGPSLDISQLSRCSKLSQSHPHLVTRGLCWNVQLPKEKDPPQITNFGKQSNTLLMKSPSQTGLEIKSCKYLTITDSGLAGSYIQMP